MPEPPKISAAEWEVMNVLWDGSPTTSGAIVSQLVETSDWQPKTIKTLLSRLVKKGFVAYSEDGHRYLYRPAKGRREVIRSESRSFLQRVFRGDGASLLAHFAQEVELSEEQKARLLRLLDNDDPDHGETLGGHR